MKKPQYDINKSNIKHWKCINCKETTETDWSETPGGQCPVEYGNGNHNWQMISETDESNEPI